HGAGRRGALPARTWRLWWRPSPFPCRRGGIQLRAKTAPVRPTLVSTATSRVNSPFHPAWALPRLASPQLPIGGYSYSQGLEMAVENGLVHDSDSARRWLSDQLLLNLARFDAPLLLAHCAAARRGDWDVLRALAEQQRASRETRELQQENRQTGYSLCQLLTGLPELDEPARSLYGSFAEPGLALGWALAARAWGIAPQDALAAWLWGWLENQLAVLMKTLPLGQQAAQ